MSAMVERSIPVFDEMRLARPRCRRSPASPQTAAGETGVAHADGEQLVGALAGAVKQVERRRGELGSLFIEFHVRRALGFELAERIRGGLIQRIRSWLPVADEALLV